MKSVVLICTILALASMQETATTDVDAIMINVNEDASPDVGNDVATIGADDGIDFGSV